MGKKRGIWLKTGRETEWEIVGEEEGEPRENRKAGGRQGRGKTCVAVIGGCQHSGHSPNDLKSLLWSLSFSGRISNAGSAGPAANPALCHHQQFQALEWSVLWNFLVAVVQSESLFCLSKSVVSVSVARAKGASLCSNF